MKYKFHGIVAYVFVPYYWGSWKAEVGVSNAELRNKMKVVEIENSEVGVPNAELKN